MASQGGLFVGVVIGEKQVAWGRCPVVTASLPDFPEPLAPAEAIALIQDRVAPLLQGQPAAAWRRLVARVDAVTETATIRRPLPQREEGEGLSRRALLTGRLEADKNGPPPTQEETIERPLQPALRYGVSAALLGAAALATGVTMAEALALAYDLPRPAIAAPLHSHIGTRTATTIACAHGVASLGTSWPGDDPVAELGRNGEQLQHYVRHLARYLERAAGAAYRPAIHLDLGGGFGALYDHNAGRILGALSGLEQAASPYPVRVADPVRLESRDAQIEKMAELKEYLRLRQMSLQLVARAFVQTPADALAFASNGAADLVQLDPYHMGSLCQLVDVVLAMRAHGASVLLGGSGDAPLCHVALAIQPAGIVTRPGYEDGSGIAAVRDQMTRTLAWIAARSATEEE